MTPRDSQFSAFAAAHRPALVGTVVLLGAEPDAAEAAVHAVLARMFSGWPQIPDPVRYAYAAVLGTGPGGSRLPWQQPARFELVDEVPAKTGPGLAADLARLGVSDRRVVVLQAYAGLADADIAAVLALPAAEVAAAGERARQALAALEPRRADPAQLAAELTATAHDRAVPATADDTAAGRRLLDRRRLRRALAGAVAAVLLVVGAAQLVPRVVPRPPAEPAASSPGATVPCDTGQPRCRVEIVSAWRTEMADVISSHLDPDGDYFTGYSYAYTDVYNSEGLWTGKGGALALDLYRMHRGATQVSLQIATSRQYALRCGQVTEQDCFGMRFMDGNRFTFSDSSDVSRGVEVQYAPAGTYVITAVARNVGRGQELPLGTGDLIALLQDPRLKLPPR